MKPVDLLPLAYYKYRVLKLVANFLRKCLDLLQWLLCHTKTGPKSVTLKVCVLTMVENVHSVTKNF